MDVGPAESPGITEPVSLTWRTPPAVRLAPLSLLLLILSALVLFALALPTARIVWTVNQAGRLLNAAQANADPGRLAQAEATIERARASGASLDRSFWRTYGAIAAKSATEEDFRLLLDARRAGRLDRTGELWLGEIAAATGHWEEAHESYARIDATNLLVERGERALAERDKAGAANWFNVAAVSIFSAVEREAADAARPLPSDPEANDPLLRAPGRRAIALLRIGRGFVALGDPVQAVPVLERALSEMHADPPGVRERQSIQLALARALTLTLPEETTAKEKALQRVHDLLDRAIELNRDARVYLEAGRVADLAGDPDRAIALLEEAVRLAPAEVNTYLTLGDVLRRNKLSITERELYLEGLERLPDSPELLDAHALAAYRTLSAEEAAPLLEQAAESSRNAYVFAHLGDAYRKLGASEAALRAYEWGLQRSPGADVLLDRLALFTHAGGMRR